VLGCLCFARILDRLLCKAACHTVYGRILTAVIQYVNSYDPQRGARKGKLCRRRLVSDTGSTSVQVMTAHIVRDAQQHGRAEGKAELIRTKQ
jgi:hypothetical protein